MNPDSKIAFDLNISERLAVVAGKVTAKTIRLVGAGLGSSFPGRLARKLAPSILAKLVRQTRLGIIAVTGTNGKSTTAGLLSSILKTAAFSLVHNRQGANLVSGITASLIEAANWKGLVNADYCLFEIDEAALPKVANETELNLVVVTNLFRDQLDRFGELDTTQKLIESGIRRGRSRAILNADDPNVSQLCSQFKPLFFGIESISSPSLLEAPLLFNDTLSTQTMELSYCTSCGNEISYETLFYAQLGHWNCAKCSSKRPLPQVFARNVEVSSASSQFELYAQGGSVAVSLTLPGLFNVYNALAAAAAACQLEIPLETIKGGLQGYTTLFGRSERLNISGKEVLIQLIKNPAGASQALRAASCDRRARIMIAINDNLADGRDVSWLWDADFEQLLSNDKSIIVSGRRAQDMAVRMKYTGFPSDKIICLPGLEDALRKALKETAAEETLWILPTYTCLLELQKIVKKLGCQLSET